MVKFGNIKCETCGQEVKKKQLSRHRCVKKDPNRLEKCNVCGKEVCFRNYSKHYRSCRARDFWNQHEKFFFYLLRVVRAFNRELKKERYLGTRDQKKKIIMDQTGVNKEEANIKKNPKLLAEVVKVEDEEAMKNANEAAREYGFELGNLEDEDAIKDMIRCSSPGVSCRQVIFDYLESINIVDKNVLYLIDKKMIKKDYPTNEELEENKELYKDILEARKESGYDSYYEKFYFMLADYYQHGDTGKCCFCGKFLSSLKRHLKKCGPYRKHFYENEEEAIKFYLFKFHEAALWEEYKLDDYVSYYKQYSFNYFIETVEKRLKDRNAFMERIAEGKRRFAEMNACKNKKEFVRNLIAEVDAMPPWSWSDEEEDGNKKAEEVVEEVEEENKMEEKVKEKDPFEKALEKVENEEKEMVLEDTEGEKLDEEKTKNTWALLLGGKFKAKLEEKKNVDISSSDEAEDDARELKEANILNN